MLYRARRGRAEYLRVTGARSATVDRGSTWTTRRPRAQLQSQVADVGLSVPSPTTDPALCWLIGADARAAGHAEALVGQMTTSGLDTECIDAVTRGAKGYGR